MYDDQQKGSWLSKLGWKQDGCQSKNAQRYSILGFQFHGTVGWKVIHNQDSAMEVTAHYDHKTN